MIRLGVAIVFALACGCASIRPNSISVEAEAGHACYGADCGPYGAARVSATWETK
jgi:hypothetical protein